MTANASGPPLFVVQQISRRIYGETPTLFSLGKVYVTDNLGILQSISREMRIGMKIQLTGLEGLGSFQEVRSQSDIQ